MFPIILVFILRESVDRSDNPTSRRNMNSRIVFLYSAYWMTLLNCVNISRTFQFNFLLVLLTLARTLIAHILVVFTSVIFRILSVLHLTLFLFSVFLISFFF